MFLGGYKMRCASCGLKYAKLSKGLTSFQAILLFLNEIWHHAGKSGTSSEGNPGLEWVVVFSRLLQRIVGRVLPVSPAAHSIAN